MSDDLPDLTPERLAELSEDPRRLSRAQCATLLVHPRTPPDLLQAIGHHDPGAFFTHPVVRILRATDPSFVLGLPDRLPEAPAARPAPPGAGPGGRRWR